MSSAVAVCLVIGAALLAAISQLMLKKSADAPHRSFVQEYLNPRVLLSYGLLFSTSLVNMFAMTALPYKVVPVIGTVSYVFVVLMGKFVLKEKIGRVKWAGMALIIVGILIFNI